MKKSTIYLLLFIKGSLFAQEADFKSCLKFSEKNLEQYIYSMSIYPSWIGTSDYFWYHFTTSNGTAYYLADASKGKKQKLFDEEEFAMQLAELAGIKEDGKKLPLTGLQFKENDPSYFTFSKYGKDFKYDVKHKVLQEYTKDKDKAHVKRMNFQSGYSPDSTYRVYAYRHNLFIQKQGDSTSYPLTTDGERYHSYAFNKDKDSDKEEGAAITWAGDSKCFYCLRQDRRKVKDAYLINHLARPRPTLRTYKFPMPGDPSVFTYDLHLFYPEQKQHLEIKIDKYPDQEVKIISSDFSRYSDYIYFTRKSRTCDQMDLCRVDTRTGTVFEILHEDCKPHFTDQLFECNILNRGEDIIWWSERSGWGQYYLYNRDGKLKNQVTKGHFVAGRIASLDTLGRNFIFEGYGREKGICPEYRFYYKVNFDGSAFTLLTPGDGFHSIDIAKNKKYLTDTWSRADTPPVSVLRNMKGEKIMDLENADMNLLYATGWNTPERVKIKAADGITDLYGIMYRPFNMDTLKKYPVIINVYPGPQENFVPQTFTVDDNGNNALAQLGFIVLNVGFRGSCLTRGHHFHCFGYGNLRDYALADCKYAIEQLADRYNFMDIDKVGIYGHSGGGFMAAAAIMTYPDFFKVAVSASGNHDNTIYTKWWGETYQGVKIKESSSKQEGQPPVFVAPIPTNMELAKNLKGKLLLITGEMDMNVHMAHTIRLADALIKARKRFDMMLIPGADHGLAGDYYQNLIRYYFVENLLGQKISHVDM